MTTSTVSPLESQGKGFRVRAYHSEDKQQVAEVFAAGMIGNAQIPGQKLSFWEGFIAFCIQDDLATIESTYFEKDGYFWIAVDDKDRVVGIVGIQNSGDGEGEIRRLSVKAEYRRFGVARALIATLEAWAVGHNYKRVTLTCGYILEAAHKFYKSIGYAIYRDEVFPEDPQFLLAHFEKRLVQPSSAT